MPSVIGRFGECAGNRFSLLVDGEAFGTSMLDAIAKARHYVLIELYLLESGGFAQAVVSGLMQAAERGVQVRLLLDHFGCLGFAPADRAGLRHPNIELCWYNPIQLSRWVRNFHRDHRKLIIVDDAVAFVGGFCVTDEFWPGPQAAVVDPLLARPWLDVAVKIEGPIVDDWRELFVRAWTKSGFARRQLSLPNVSINDAIGSVVTGAGTMKGRVAWASGHLHQGILREFLARASKTSARLYIATPYFLPSWRIRRTLIRAAKRGVDVRILLPGAETDHPGVRYASWRYYKKLLRHGVRIFEYQPRFIHAKIMLCDNWVSVGSCNLDHWNQRWNLEANQEVDDSRFASEVMAFFQEKFLESEEQDLKRWLKPYWRHRLLAYFWGRVDAWLMRL